MLPGLRSRWTTPLACAKPRPSHSCSMMASLSPRCGVARADQVPEVAALEELHGHVDEAVLLAEVEDGDDVRVVELGGRLGLALEAAAEVGLGGEGRGDRLDRDEAVQERVLGLVDLAHRALADLPDDPVLPDPVQVHHGPATSWKARSGPSLSPLVPQV